MILKKDNEQLAREKWEKLFSRDQMLDEPGQVLMTLPATPETIEVPRKQFRAVIKSAPQPRPRKSWLYRQMKSAR